MHVVVDAYYIAYVAKYGTYVVADQEYGAMCVDLFQEFVQLVLVFFVYVGVGFVEDEYFRGGRTPVPVL